MLYLSQTFLFGESGQMEAKNLPIFLSFQEFLLSFPEITLSFGKIKSDLWNLG